MLHMLQVKTNHFQRVPDSADHSMQHERNMPRLYVGPSHRAVDISCNSPDLL